MTDADRLDDHDAVSCRLAKQQRLEGARGDASERAARGRWPRDRGGVEDGLPLHAERVDEPAAAWVQDVAQVTVRVDDRIRLDRSRMRIHPDGSASSRTTQTSHNSQVPATITTIVTCQKYRCMNVNHSW